jgi:hypothetical protein
LGLALVGASAKQQSVSLHRSSKQASSTLSEIAVPERAVVEASVRDHDAVPAGLVALLLLSLLFTHEGETKLGKPA